ncbi:MAG: VWA domain-containing protein [Chloroflexi bacterium]|nr:MAG: VWA domain-containing protein [Chloroflexota bacterium]
MTQPEAQGQLLHNLVLFGRLLRALGLDVNPGRMIDLAEALGYVEIGRKTDFYYTARSLLVHRREDIPLFDYAFDLFWRKPAEQGVEITGGLLRRSHPEMQPIIAPPSLQEPSAANNDDSDNEPEETQEIIEVTQTYSRREILRQKDFADLTEEEVREIKRMMAEMVWELGERRTRRQKPGAGRQLDLRRSLRRNLRYGGEMVELPRRQPKFKPRPLVIIADISGSMERYTRLLLHFIYSLAAGLEQHVEAFVFSTRLTRITRQLQGRDIDRALHEVAHAVPDWAGGTRIGDALKAFNFRWGRRVLGQGAVVLLISDGWDRGDPTLLRQEIGRLQRSAYRLIWLNPLLGSPRYEPLTRGMQAALPYIDDFLPVHNLSSLADLATHLAALTAQKRPSRRQIPLYGAAFIRR